MATLLDEPRATTPIRPWWQFSCRTLLVAMTTSALSVALTAQYLGIRLNDDIFQPTYRATTSLYVESYSPEDPNAEHSSFPEDFGGTVDPYELLHDRRLLEKVLARKNFSILWRAIDNRESIRWMQERLSIARDKDSEIVSIAFECADPKLSVRVVSAVVEELLAHCSALEVCANQLLLELALFESYIDRLEYRWLDLIDNCSDRLGEPPQFVPTLCTLDRKIVKNRAERICMQAKLAIHEQHIGSASENALGRELPRRWHKRVVALDRQINGLLASGEAEAPSSVASTPRDVISRLTGQVALQRQLRDDVWTIRSQLSHHRPTPIMFKLSPQPLLTQPHSTPPLCSLDVAAAIGFFLPLLIAGIWNHWLPPCASASARDA